MTRCIVIGIDAASWDVINPLIQKNKLPNISKIIKNGISAPLKSTYPPITPAAWNSMITGVNPGKHGVIDFVEQDIETYAVRPVSSYSLRVKTLWEILNEHDYKVGVVNFPTSYPPPKVESFFISGLSSPEHGTYAHPPKLMKYLKKKNYRIHPRFSYKEGGEKKFFEEIKELTNIQSEVFLELMERENWDLFFVVFMGLDWIQHYLWDYEISPGTNAVEHFYEYLDEKIGAFLENVGSEDYVIIVSDHGMKKIKGEIHTNTLLESWGYLKRKNYNPCMKNKVVNIILSVGRRLPFDWKILIKKKIPESPLRELQRSQNSTFALQEQVDWGNTQVFSYGFMGRLYIHSRGKYPSGIVSPEEYENIREEIISKLEGMNNPETGEKMFGDVYRAEEFYKERSNECPDIIFSPLNLDYMVYNDFGKYWITQSRGRRADHSMEGIFILKGSGIQDIKKCNIVDIAPTILSLFGIDIPEGMEGKSFFSTITKKSLVSTSAPNEKRTDRIYKADEEDEIKKRLEGLGYL